VSSEKIPKNRERPGANSQSEVITRSGEGARPSSQTEETMKSGGMVRTYLGASFLSLREDRMSRKRGKRALRIGTGEV